MDEESLSAEEKKFFRKLFSSQTSKDERESQLRKYRQLVDLLVNAGYFRARIAALSPFDKVSRYKVPRYKVPRGSLVCPR